MGVFDFLGWGGASFRLDLANDTAPPGGAFEGHVRVLGGDRPQRVAAIDVELAASRRRREVSRSGDSVVEDDRVFSERFGIGADLEVSARGELSIPFRVSVPASAEPSAAAFRAYELVLHVDVPGELDPATPRVRVRVVAPDVSPDERAARVVRACDALTSIAAAAGGGAGSGAAPLVELAFLAAVVDGELDDGERVAFQKVAATTSGSAGSTGELRGQLYRDGFVSRLRAVVDRLDGKRGCLAAFAVLAETSGFHRPFREIDLAEAALTTVFLDLAGLEGLELRDTWADWLTHRRGLSREAALAAVDASRGTRLVALERAREELDRRSADLRARSPGGVEPADCHVCGAPREGSRCAYCGTLL